jgi:hypothetical protein
LGADDRGSAYNIKIQPNETKIAHDDVPVVAY